MSLTKSVLTKSDRNRRIQKIQKKVVRSERGTLSHNQVTNDKDHNWTMDRYELFRCKTCYYYSSVGVINHSRLILSNKCPECMSENLDYYSASS